MQLRERRKCCYAEKLIFPNPKIIKKKPRKKNKVDKMIQTSKSDNSFGSLKETIDDLMSSTVKYELNESYDELSFSSFTSLSSQKHNNDFHKWLLAKREVPIVPQFSTRLERLQWLQEQRDVGLYVICDNCEKLRYLQKVVDPLELPEKWYCYMSDDPTENSCQYPRKRIETYKLTELVNNKYNAGSVVWAKVQGHAWFPGIIDDDPDYEVFFNTEDEENPDEPTEYHVTFLGENVQRAWCKTNKIKSFKENPYKAIQKKFYRNRKQIETARKQALSALELNPSERLRKFSFISRWKKPLL